MTWSESGYTNEQTDKPQNKLEGQSDKVYNTTDFLSKFEGNQNTIVSACMNEIQSDIQLKEGFDNLLKSGIPNDLVNKIKQELKDNAELDEETLKILVQSILAESITDFKIGSIGTIEGLTTQKVQKEEKAVQKEERAVQKEERAVQKEEKAVQEEEKADNSTEQAEDWGKMNKEMLKKCSDYREQLLVGHEKLDQKIKNEAKNIKDNLNIDEATKQKREQNGIDENFIDNYILVKVTLNEVKKDSSFDVTKIQEFEGLVGDLDNGLKLSNRDILLKSIDNACNIPDTSLSSFSSKNISQTRTEMFNSDIGNDNLIKARDANKESNDYSNVFPEGEADIVRMYGKFVPTGEKNYVEEYNKHLADNTIDQYRNTQECQKFLKYLEQVKKTVDNKTKEFVEEMCILSQIKGMSMCIGEESENKFSLNKAREIEDKDGEITLKGHIDGVDIAIRHNSKDSNAHLETSSKFIKSNKDTFTISKEGKFSPSNFILPGQKEVFDTVTQRVKDSMKSGGILDKAGNRDEFLAAMNGDLQSDIVGDMENLYKDTALVHHYMKNKVRGEKIVNNSLSHIQKVKPNIDFTLPISPNSNAKLYPYFKIINFNIENSTAEEKNKLNDIISEIGKIINNYKNGTYDKDFKYPEIIENYLRNDDWKGGDEEKKFGKISDLFSYYSSKSKDNRFDREGDGGTPSKMVINDLYRDLFDSRNGKSPVAGEWQEEYNKEHADSDLDAQLSDFPSSPGKPSLA